jgi:nitrogen regulatory protein PII
MKYIIGIIQPDRLDEVVEALEEEEIILLTAWPKSTEATSRRAAFYIS